MPRRQDSWYLELPMRLLVERITKKKKETAVDKNKVNMFVFSPKRDMLWFRAIEIKESPNPQAVPKILVHKKMTLPGSTLAQVPLISPILTCMTSFAELDLSNALIFPKKSGPKKIKDSLTLQAVFNTLVNTMLYAFSE